MPAPIEIVHLGAADIPLLRKLLRAFAVAFEDMDSYACHPPGDAYLARLLASDTFIAVAALHDGEVVAGLAAYELHKFEQERSEIYIYDLAVLPQHRRQGIATRLILKLKEIAAQRRAYVIYVQADLVDAPAIALYGKLGRRENVLHFDIDVD